MKKSLWFIIVFVFCSCLNLIAQQNSVFSFTGKVKDQFGKGISRVVVNNGVHFTVTNAKGEWSLLTDTLKSKFVSISTPAAYQLPEKEGLADNFFVPVRVLAREKAYNFILEKREKINSNFYYIAISDPQIYNAHDMNRWRTETVPDMKEVTDSLKRDGEVVAMTLGDLVFDNMDMWNEYKESLKNTGMTVFQCIGNHDFDKKYQDLHNMEYGTPTYAEMVYNRYFGPTDYSFNIGDAHIVTMKDINYVGHKHFVESLTGAQLAWLKKDLSYVPKGSLVLLNMHAAAWNHVYPKGNIRNAGELKEVLKDYKVHMFCGHTHFYQNIEVASNLYQHNIGAACGAWWGGWVNRCGAPNGYLVVDVKGDNVKWHYKGTRRFFNYQFRIYKKGEFKTQSSFVVANIWDWDKSCRAIWYQDGKLMGDMEQFVDADETFASSLKDRSNAIPTGHLFRAMPADGARNIKIEFINRFGEVYTQTVNL